MAENPIEIPQALREQAEQNVKRAHAAYQQLAEFMTSAMNAWFGALPSHPVAAGLKDIQALAMDFAKENAESAFVFAGKISNARSPQEIFALHTQFAQDRMQVFVRQTQQLYTLIKDALQKPERGSKGASTGAAPSNSIAAGFSDVQDRAMAMAKKDAESAFTLVESIIKAQNVQEILTLQTHFAQDQMEAYARQTKDIQRLIEETLQKLQRG